MQAVENKAGSWTVLTLSGKITAATSPEFQSRLMSLIQTGAPKIALDFSGVDYMSSAGIRVVILGLKEQRAKNGELVFCRLGEGLQTLFNVAGLTALVKILPELPDDAKAGS